jgi:hypothetical protein
VRRTIVDVARAAGVSTATVDRVLNGRDGVRALTRDRVIAAARETGYLAVASAAVPTRERLQLDFVLQSGPNTFMDLLAGHLANVGATREAEADVHVHRVDGFSPKILAATLRELRPAPAPAGGRGDFARRVSGRRYVRCRARCLFISNMPTRFFPNTGSSLASARISRRFLGSCRPCCLM